MHACAACEGATTIDVPGLGPFTCSTCNGVGAVVGRMTLIARGGEHIIRRCNGEVAILPWSEVTQELSARAAAGARAAGVVHAGASFVPPGVLHGLVMITVWVRGWTFLLPWRRRRACATIVAAIAPGLPARTELQIEIVAASRVLRSRPIQALIHSSIHRVECRPVTI